MIESRILYSVDRSFLTSNWARCKRMYRVSFFPYPDFFMRFSTIALLAVTAIVFSASAARSEEPERASSYNVPETTIVPLNLLAMRHEVLIADREKSTSAKAANSVMHIDENNRLVGLSN